MTQTTAKGRDSWRTRVGSASFNTGGGEPRTRDQLQEFESRETYCTSE